MNARLLGAVDAVSAAIAGALAINPDRIGPDDDLILDLGMKPIDLESLSLIVDEIFSVQIPEALFKSGLYRTPAALAEWLISRSDERAWQTARAARRA